MNKFSCGSDFLQEDFIGYSKREGNPRARVRLLGLHYLQVHQNYSKVAELLCVDRHTIRSWQQRYEQEGLAGLIDKAGRGQRCRLTQDELSELAKVILAKQDTLPGGRLDVHDIRALAQEAYKLTYSPSGMYGLLRRMGLSWITARSQHPKADEAKQALFKKTL